MKGVSSTRGLRIVFPRLFPTIMLTALLVASTLLTFPIASAATFDVNSTADAIDCNPGDGVAETAPGNGQCALRAAIMEANALPGADIINLPEGTYALSISGTLENACATGDLDVTDDVTIVGSGQERTIVDGAYLDRVFHVPQPASGEVRVVIESITVTHGSVEYGGGLWSSGTTTLAHCIFRGNWAEDGGGVFNQGNMRITGCRFLGNGAETGGGIRNSMGTLVLEASVFSDNEASWGGGGLLNKAISIVYGCTFSGNHADGNGGAFFNDGTVNVSNSTLSGNTAHYGGGVYAWGTLTVINCTVTENVANELGGGICLAGSTVAAVGNTILAENSVVNEDNRWEADVRGRFTSLGHNILGTADWGSGFEDGVDGDMIYSRWLKSFWWYAWLLAPLEDNGGPTETHALLKYSLAFDAGDNALVTAPPFGDALAYDQRGEGYARICDADKDGTATVDIGAFEVQNPNAPVAVDDAYVVDEGGTLQISAPGCLANDSDADGDALAARLVTSPEHGGGHSDEDGSFVYVHDGGEEALDTFSYCVDDGFAYSATATVTIVIRPVNDPPVAQGKTYAVDEGRILAVAAPGILSRCVDPDSDPLSAHLLTSTLHGALTLNADGSFVYVHDGSETTQDTFTFEARDGSTASNPATVTIIIHPVYDMPDADDDAYEVDEGGILDVAAPGLLANDTGQEGSPLTAVTPTQPSHGALTLKPDGSFTYTHDGSDSTTDSFRYVLRDASSFCDVATVSITVHPINDWDVNRDDSVDALDLQLVINRVIGIATEGDADVNDDGRSDAIDVQLLINAVLGV